MVWGCRGAGGCDKKRDLNDGYLKKILSHFKSKLIVRHRPFFIK